MRHPALHPWPGAHHCWPGGHGEERGRQAGQQGAVVSTLVIPGGSTVAGGGERGEKERGGGGGWRVEGCYETEEGGEEMDKEDEVENEDVIWKRW